MSKEGTVAQRKHCFSSMPWMLRILVAASLGIGVGFCLLPLFPSSSFGFDEHVLTYQELWQTRVALAVMAVGVLMLVVGIAIFLRKSWVRPVLVVLPLLELLPFLVVHWAYDAPSPVSSLAVFAASCVAWAMLAVGYLFGTRSAREYFANDTWPR